MSITVVGSIGLDTIETPFGRRDNILGGAAVFFSAAAGIYNKINLVGIVGTDFPDEHLQTIKTLGMDTEGLEIREGTTFKWHGQYEYDMNIRHTLNTDLGLFSEFSPILPSRYTESPFLFLANIDPVIQLDVLNQSKAGFTMMDTMDFWIVSKRPELCEVISRVDLVLMNDSEARQFTNEYRLVDAAKGILKMGPDMVIIKKGEHGAMLVTKDDCFIVPAYPLCEVKDPTGAGDSFAGGFLGYLSTTENRSRNEIRNAIVHGSIVASFAVEDFSLNALAEVTKEKMEERYRHFTGLLEFDPWRDLTIAGA